MMLFTEDKEKSNNEARHKDQVAKLAFSNI